MDISGVYLTYGEGDSRPRSSRVKSARYGRLKGLSVGEAFSELKVHKREKFFVSDFEFFTIL
jgi:hypothetical protein